MDTDESVRLLGAATVSRLAFVDDGVPDILPVNHLVLDGRVYFRTAPGTKLGAAAAGERVAMEADDYDAPAETGWSVVVKGTASIVTDEERLERLHALNFEPWASPDKRSFWVEVSTDEVTGRRLSEG